MLGAHRAAPDVSHRAHRSTGDGTTKHQHRILIMTMKRGLSELFLLLLSSSVSGLGSVVSKNYKYFPDHYTWKDAQKHCRSLDVNTDLVTIYTQSDTDQMQMEEYYAWIGLYRSDNYWCDWYWINGQYLHACWNFHHGDYCAKVFSSDKKLYSTHCKQYAFFICHERINGNFNYTFIPQSKTWYEARTYCKTEFDDLAVLTNNSHLNAVVCQRDFPVWTGLRRDGQTWNWSPGSSSVYRKWAPNEPGSNGDCVSISSLSKEMATQDCNARFPFVCFKANLVLVKETKTWEEALEHCRALGYELVSVQPGEDHNTVMDYVMGADTEKVWTGLRFLAGHWLWVNKANLCYTDLPLCPHQLQHCGALSKNDMGSVETTDCMEKLNFLCYSTP